MLKEKQKIAKPVSSFAENTKVSHQKAQKQIFNQSDVQSFDEHSNQEDVFDYFDKINESLDHHVDTDDICTPMACVKQMLDYLPQDFWNNKNIKVLDPCCGNGNFAAYAMFKTDKKNIFFNEINGIRLKTCKQLLSPLDENVTNINFLADPRKDYFDLIMANPPYSGGGNKNQSLSNLFIEKSIDVLKENGYLCFVTPNNWMTFNQHNSTLKRLLNEGYFLVIDNDIKKYFPKVGSSFTVFVWKKGKHEGKTRVINNYLIKDQQNVELSKDMKFIPLYLSQTVVDLADKLLSDERNAFDYRCDLHNFTKKDFLSDIKDDIFQFETIHTARKTRYAKIKQDIYNQWIIVVPLSTYYVPYIKHHVNLTQSVGYLAFSNKEDAIKTIEIITKPEFKLLVHLTRYGNFNNIMLLRHLRFDGTYSLTKNEVQEIQKLNAFIKY